MFADELSDGLSSLYFIDSWRLNTTTKRYRVLHVLRGTSDTRNPNAQNYEIENSVHVILSWLCNRSEIVNTRIAFEHDVVANTSE